MSRLNTDRLKLELFRSNMKQRDLADRVGVSEVSMSRYFNGTRMPKGHILVEICKTLNTTPEYLTEMEGLDNPNIAFAKTKVAVMTYANQWTYQQKKELADYIIDALKKNKPPKGLVQVMKVTEKQFAKMEYIVGEEQNEVIDSDERIIFL